MLSLRSLLLCTSGILLAASSTSALTLIDTHSVGPLSVTAAMVPVSFDFGGPVAPSSITLIFESCDPLVCGDGLGTGEIAIIRMAGEDFVLGPPTFPPPPLSLTFAPSPDLLAGLSDGVIEALVTVGLAPGTLSGGYVVRANVSMRVVVVPEPTTPQLLSIGLAGMVAIRRCRAFSGCGANEERVRRGQ